MIKYIGPYDNKRQPQSTQYQPSAIHPGSPGYPSIRQYENEPQYMNQNNQNYYMNHPLDNRDNFYNDNINMNVNISPDMRGPGYMNTNMNSEPVNNFQNMKEMDIVKATRDQM
jgi:hypothetical protein